MLGTTVALLVLYLNAAKGEETPYVLFTRDAAVGSRPATVTTQAARTNHIYLKNYTVSFGVSHSSIRYVVSPRPISIDCDRNESLIYAVGSYSVGSLVYSALFRGPMTEHSTLSPVDAKQHRGKMTGLSFNPSTRSLYYGLGSLISLYEIDTTTTKLVIVSRRTVLSLAVDSKRRFLYYTYGGRFRKNDGALLRKDLSQKFGETTELNDQLKNPTGLVVDESTGNVFFSDEHWAKIFCYGCSTRKILSTVLSEVPKSLSILNDRLYFRSDNAFYSLPLDSWNTSPATKIFDVEGHIADFKVVLGGKELPTLSTPDTESFLHAATTDANVMFLPTETPTEYEKYTEEIIDTDDVMPLFLPTKEIPKDQRFPFEPTRTNTLSKAAGLEKKPTPPFIANSAAPLENNEKTANSGVIAAAVAVPVVVIIVVLIVLVFLWRKRRRSMEPKAADNPAKNNAQDLENPNYGAAQGKRSDGSSLDNPNYASGKAKPGVALDNVTYGVKGKEKNLANPTHTSSSGQENEYEDPVKAFPPVKGHYEEIAGSQSKDGNAPIYEAIN